MDIPCLWHPSPSRNVNIFIAFQCRLRVWLTESATLRLFGCSFYRVYLDGVELLEGPARFAPTHPEYDETAVDLRVGERVLTVVVHDYGVHTRIVAGGIAPFLQCELIGTDGSAYALAWMCKELDAYRHLDRRINGQLGWMECCDTRRLPDLSEARPGNGWTEPAVVPGPLGRVSAQPKTVGDVLRLPVEGALIARGRYADVFGYADDDPPVRFISRDLVPELPVDGAWFRFDFGKVGLYRPNIVVNVPAGTIVEAGYCEMLTRGRVYPVIPFSLSASCHLDRWIAAGGKQTLQCFVPRGFRYMEVHIAAPPDRIGGLETNGVQRTLYGPSPGTFSCSDPLLNRIWETGVETLRSCCEDALIDTPVRERGQWLGDAALIGMEILSAAYGDLSLVRRALLQASYCRRADGLAAGLCPGQEAYLTSYALYWIGACLRYSRLSGDDGLLHECYDTARKTVDFFWSNMTERGVYRLGMWDFLDWGHTVGDDEINVSLNLILLQTLLDLREWEGRIGATDMGSLRHAQIETMVGLADTVYRTPEGLMAKSIPAEGTISSPAKPGFHATVFGLLYGLFEKGDPERAAVEFVKWHMNACFPNDCTAPRLSHPSANHERLITPGFGHFALAALWETGEADFVMDRYRTCWGWMLGQGATTWLEVFDTRWSHCHAWSGCPTWQLSRYALGLVPMPERDKTLYRLRFQPGTLAFASGKTPLVGGEPGSVAVSWTQTGDGLWTYTVEPDRPIVVMVDCGARYRITDNARTDIADRSEVPIGKRLELRIAFGG